jgi:hypothetical protein
MKIAFVLGAGASKPYNYPSGDELKGLLLAKDQGEYVFQKKLEELGYDTDSVSAFLNALFKAEYDTLDEFIAAHRASGDVPLMAKEAIALLISGSEDESILFGQGGARWYRLVVDFLRANPEMAHRDRMAFLTFNYDRSLEHYLYDSLRHSGNAFQDIRWGDFFHGNFIHIHGNLGFLPWQNRSGDKELITRGYGEVPTGPMLRSIAQRMSAPYQTMSPGGLAPILSNADVVAIMGFGFHPQNLAKIGFTELLGRPNVKFCATVSVLPAERRNRLEMEPAVTTFDLDCANFVRFLFMELTASAKAGKMELREEWLASYRQNRR